MDKNTLPKLLVSREEAEKRIERQIEKGQWIYDQPTDSYDELEKICMEAQNWSKYNSDLLIRLFDNPVLAEYISYDYHRLSDSDIHQLLLDDYISDIHEYQIGEYQTDMGDSISSLEGILERLELCDDPSKTSPRTLGNDVFIVHGHDEGARNAVARFVEKLGLKASILDEQVNRGQTIIEKFEREASNAGFAIVLLTPDDVGAPKDHKDKLQPRARQNVILELGYFLHRLGRERVCVLYKVRS